MQNLNSVPASVADLVNQLNDSSIPADKRQNYRKTLEDIRRVAGQAIVRFDADCAYQASKATNKTKVRASR